METEVAAYQRKDGQYSLAVVPEGHGSNPRCPTCVTPISDSTR